jgi:hypothetical protein
MANPIAVPGTNVPSGAAVSPGGAQGVQGIQGPTSISADAGNIATLGSDNLVLVPQSQIWSARLRSFNAIGNPTFEVDQRTANAGVSNPASGTFACDRWTKNGSGTYTVNCRVIVNPFSSGGVPIPGSGTNFRISTNYFMVNLTASQATLGASDFLAIMQNIEGPRLRELMADNHSISLIVNSTVAPLKFSIVLRDAGGTRALVKLCTITTANTWQLIQLPNLPIWDSGGGWSLAPGSAGYQLAITLACGSTYTAPTADVWNTGNFMAAPGTDNFVSKPTSSLFYVAFIQHEPGAICTTPIDCPFMQNYDDCLRYFQKSYAYSNAPGTATSAGIAGPWIPAGVLNAITPIRFIKPMAKTPTITGYSYSTGAANNVRDITAGVDRAIAAANTPADSGFNGFNITAGANVLTNYGFHWIADTGW